MHLRQIVFGLFLASIIPASLYAEDPASTAPASQPTTVSAVSFPKSALKAYNFAMRLGDVPGMMALQHATTDDEKHIARCSSQSDLQVADLEQATREKFGGSAESKIAAAIGDEDDDAIDAAKETITGSTATIAFPGGDSPVSMVRSGDGWAIDVSATLRNSNATVEELCNEIIRRGSAAKVTAQEIAAGQFKSVGAAVEALKSRLKES